MLFGILKNLKKGILNRTNYIKAKEGKLIEDEKDIMLRWKEYFRELFNTDIMDTIKKMNKNEINSTKTMSLKSKTK